jgi:hypothetical protein
VVDDPKEAVRLVTRGIRKPWWRPLDDEARAGDGGPPDVARARGSKPIETAASADTGEGTRYGSPREKDDKEAREGRRSSRSSKLTISRAPIGCSPG